MSYQDDRRWDFDAELVKAYLAMSDRWRWSDRCVGQPCCGDCDRCDMEDDDEEDSSADCASDRASGSYKMVQKQG